MFKIGDFSKLSSTSIRMLRYYDEIGLLQPTIVDSNTHFRYYTADQLDRINTINILKKLGFSFAISKEILEKNTTDIQKYLALREQELIVELETVKTQTKQLQTIQRMLETHQEILKYHVQYKLFPKQKVMSLRKTITSFSNEHEIWNTLASESKKANIQLPKTSIAMSVYHDSEFHEEQVDMEVQSTMDRLYPNTDTLTFYELPQREVASVIFSGSFEQMPQVTSAIAHWIETNAYQIAGPTFIISHVSPAMTPNPEDWISEVCYPITKNKGEKYYG